MIPKTWVIIAHIWLDFLSATSTDFSQTEANGKMIMPTLKQIIRLPLRLARRMTVASKIRSFDQKSDYLFNGENNSLKNGWLKISIDDLLESPGITAQLQSSPLRKKPDDSQKIYYSWDIPQFIWTAVLNSTKISTIVKGYIGPNARLDDIYVKSVTDGLTNGAEGWHDDNVGYRLKMFLVFDVEGIPSDTLLLPQSRPNLYEVKVQEEIVRMLGKPDHLTRPEEIRMKYQAGDGLIFDTNLLHRGDYTNSSGVRYCLVIEFIDRHKADFLQGKGPCGPGQGKFPVLIPVCSPKEHSYLLQHNLIDPDLLHLGKEKIEYGYPKMTQKRDH